MSSRSLWRRPLSSPEDQKVTFVELFFDLVFVFSVTQVGSLLHDGFTVANVGQAILVFWLVWWAWSQFTWTLNAVDTTHPVVEIATFVAAMGAFFMAIALPATFHGRGGLFASAYLFVRVVGLFLYIWASREEDSQQSGANGFAMLSVGGFVSVLIGAVLGGTAQYALWGFAIFLDVGSTVVVGRFGQWNIRPDHFVERHGLFVIIALGETLVVAGSGMVTGEWTGVLLVNSVLAVTTTCLLWWTYFSRAKLALEQAFAHRTGKHRTDMARDSFSLLHFPMVCGIVAYAHAIAEIVAQPGASLNTSIRLALALGVALFVGGMAIALIRAVGWIFVPRLAVTAIVAVILMAWRNTSSHSALLIVLLGLVVITLVEQKRFADPSSLSARRN